MTSVTFIIDSKKFHREKFRENDITKSIDSKKTNFRDTGVAPKMRLPCTTCGQEFQSKKKLLNHMFHHDDEPNKAPVFTSYIFPNRISLTIALDISLFLNICVKLDQIEKIEILDEDNNSVSSGNQEIFLCDSCPENFRTESQLQKHFRAKHDQQNNATNKTKNNQTMNGASQLPANKPANQQLTKQTGKFECEICSVKFMKVRIHDYVIITSYLACPQLLLLLRHEKSESRGDNLLGA